ncbi:hypothetical protein, partial [Mycobacteroides abscessus]|uniref:hypothetical protein n=1 Tax=Mycobacteroides abscessus TaxID=36809 RepID=UPI001C71A6BE
MKPTTRKELAGRPHLAASRVGVALCRPDTLSGAALWGAADLRRSVQFGGHQLVSRSAQWGWLRGWWRLVTFSGMDEWVAAVGAA